MPSEPPSILFVCLGNICRSPMAEAVFAHLVDELGLKGRVGKVDSCGTGAYHQGEKADSRTLAVLAQHSIASSCRARRLRGSDFDDFTYVLGMDAANVRNLHAQKPRGSKAIVELFGKW
ncbi:phosphotyrosine protein phosphatases I, partial [Tilletiopsis washingtonensis]